MKTVVLYSTRSGNTGKIAEAISSELNCLSFKIDVHSKTSTVNIEDFELVFLGTGILTGNPYRDLEQYIRSIDLKIPKIFVLFLTWGGAGKTNEIVATKLKTILENKGQKVIADVFKCYGAWKFSPLRRGHPDRGDIQAAKKWARDIITTVKS